jgi:hypothetical protein
MGPRRARRRESIELCPEEEEEEDSLDDIIILAQFLQ